MTAHLKYDHCCKKCHRPFIPLVRCPECGNLETVGAAPRIKAFVEAGKENIGSPVFGIFSLADHYIILATHILSIMEEAGAKELLSVPRGVDRLASSAIGRMSLSGATCLKSHLRSFAKAIIAAAAKQEQSKKAKRSRSSRGQE